MKVNKINFLIISLFLNNTKSVKLVSQENGGVYKYQDRQQTLIPQKLQNETYLEYNIRNYTDLLELPSRLLEYFISEMKLIEDDDNTFDIENNGQIVHYKLTKEEHLISIKRINNTDPLYNILPNPLPDPLPDNMKYSPNIRYTVLVLSSYRHNMQSFLVNNAAIDSDCPNSNFYIHKNDCLAVHPINSSYYIFPKNNITLMKNRPELSHLFEEEKTITCYDRCRNFSRDWMPTLSVITAIVVPLAGKKIKQE